MARSMTIGVPDFPSLWAKAVCIAAYLKNRLPHNHLQTNISPYECFHQKRPTILHLKPFGSKCHVHTREEERPSGSKHLPRALQAIVVGYTSSPAIYRVFTPENERIFTTRDIKFPKIEPVSHPAPTNSADPDHPPCPH